MSLYEKIDEFLGKRIRDARVAKGLTQKELANKIGKTLSSVQKYEMNQAKPPLNVIQDISLACGVPVRLLLNIDSQSTPFMDFVMQNFNSLDEAQSILQRALIHRKCHSCWCCECKHYAELEQVCVNGDSDNCADFMSPYSSCEHCERK